MQSSLGKLEIKANMIRREVLEKVYKTGKGHIGGTFSCTDILTALYYGGILRVEPTNPEWPGRDRLIIGKGHACLAVYYILVDLGFFSESRLDEYGTQGSSLGGQLNIDTPGVEYNSGSLGHAIGIGAGMALAAKLDERNSRIFTLIGDGECDEGSIWESVNFAGRYRLNNLIGIIDCNKLGVTDFVAENSSSDLRNKFESSGWRCTEIDGHDFEDIFNAFSGLDDLDGPLMIIANTVKGKGISFMENEVKWHHAVPSKAEYELAKRDLELLIEK